MARRAHDLKLANVMPKVKNSSTRQSLESQLSVLEYLIVVLKSMFPTIYWKP